MNNYKLIDPPINIRYFNPHEFLNLNDTEALLFKQWFMSTKTIRLKLICNIIFNKSFNNITQNDLSLISNFVNSYINTKPTTYEEKIYILENLPPSIKAIYKFRDWSYTKQDNSLIWDISILFSEYLIKYSNNISWSFQENKKYQFYNMPILRGNTTSLFCTPFIVVQTYTNKILTKEWDKDAFWQLIIKWLKYLD